MLLLFMNLYRPWFSSRLDSCATAVRRTISRGTGAPFCATCVSYMRMFLASYLVPGMRFLICIPNVVRVPVPPSTSHSSFSYLRYSRALRRFPIASNKSTIGFSAGTKKKKQIKPIHILHSPSFPFLNDDPSLQQHQQQYCSSKISTNSTRIQRRRAQRPI